MSEARGRYTLARQRQAFLVSAHIFDLALTGEDLNVSDRLSFGFAAAIGYRRGGRDPNATAIMNRLRGDIRIDIPVLDHIDTVAVEAGLAFLGFETRTLFGWLGTWRRQLAEIARVSELPDLTTTVFGTTHMVILGIEDLLTYFARGRTARLQGGNSRLLAAASGQAGPGDLNARWVAAHLLNLSGEAEAGSLWNPQILPRTTSDLVRQAFTVGTPPVLTLWEPQRKLLSGEPSPLDPDVRRIVLAVPTSGGKTLLAQILAVAHLANQDSSVCYVTPTRSLGREVRRAMSSRVRILQKEAGSEQADYPTIWDLFEPDTNPPDVEVMTPERLGHMLRHNPGDVVDRFGMFIIDEAQLLKEARRGFLLESVISLLQILTRDREHKIVLISAAMGNVGGIAKWLSPDGAPLKYESDWRGPRRLHAAFTTKAHWSRTETEKTRGHVWKFRHTTQLSGEIRLRMADGQRASLVTGDDIDWRIVRKSTDGNSRKKNLPTDNGLSTKQYEIASDMITALGHAGSVLVVTSTRPQAQLLARGIADRSDDEFPALAPLIDFVREQIGDEHPLVGVLRRGVGFHHARLPIEVLEALEEAARNDVLPYLTCTSTLTEGVNLPVRTVVVYDQPFPGQPEDTRLRGARLVNAMGRAGRAGRETEGWIVLVRGAEPTEEDFELLNPDPDALAITSALLSEGALEAFADLEVRIRDDADAVFTADDIASDFVGFVWNYLAVGESVSIDPDNLDLEQLVDATLAASQSDSSRAACIRVAEAVRSSYARSDPEARRRWPRTGTSVGSARTIDGLAIRLANNIARLEVEGTLPEVGDPYVAVRIPPILDALLNLPEAPRWRFLTTAKGQEIEVSPVALLKDWLSGLSLSQMAGQHLAAATPAAWRVEQMVGAVTEQFEHYLSWTVGALVQCVNARLEEQDVLARFCPELGTYIRYGVDSLPALILMSSGIRSRRLAHSVATHLPAETPATREDIRSWLAETGISSWRDTYGVSASEALDLLEFTRVRSRSLLKALLESGATTVDLVDVTSALPVQGHHDPLTLERARDEPEPAPLCVYAANDLIARVASQDHADVQSIIDTGLELALQLVTEMSQVTLRVSLTTSETEPEGGPSG
ncbi:DEAD/DEAH box helicase [Mycobacterium hackensackense]|uniref:DEAD/DEAH box helicase n=1 Tax=Mycobacterium hackensackense TaxID=228909 RepID=UPI002265CA86|nr:DEAD/DEAH box helicase [Mycobacterium hackensackense]